MKEQRVVVRAGMHWLKVMGRWGGQKQGAGLSSALRH